MKLKALISATLLTISVSVSSQVHANYCQDDESRNDGILSTQDRNNRNLENGEYDFAQLHLLSGKTFNDLWSFSVAENAIASVSIFDLEFGTSGFASALNQFGFDTFGHNTKSQPGGAKLLDNKFLSFSLFDEDGNLLGTAGENGTLSNLALQAGERYTLSVSAQIKGVFGGAYLGALNLAPAAVPLGDSLPFFASALGVLGLRYRKRLQLRR